MADEIIVLIEHLKTATQYAINDDDDSWVSISDLYSSSSDMQTITNEISFGRTATKPSFSQRVFTLDFIIPTGADDRFDLVAFFELGGEYALTSDLLLPTIEGDDESLIVMPLLFTVAGIDISPANPNVTITGVALMDSVLIARDYLIDEKELPPGTVSGGGVICSEEINLPSGDFELIVLITPGIPPIELDLDLNPIPPPDPLLPITISTDNVEIEVGDNKIVVNPYDVNIDGSHKGLTTSLAMFSTTFSSLIGRWDADYNDTTGVILVKDGDFITVKSHGSISSDASNVKIIARRLRNL